MLKVDIVFSKSIYGPTGDCTLVRSLGEMRDKFTANGVDLRIISLDKFEPQSAARNSIKVSWKHKVSAFLTRYSALATRLALHLADDKRNDRILDYYNTIPDKGDVITFHDLMLCYRFLKRNPSNNQLVQCTIHAPGDIWEAFINSYPRIKSPLLASFRKDVIDTLLKGCANIGFDADSPRKEFCRLYPYSEENTYFVYNGIPHRDFPSRETFDKLKLICIATLNNRKNEMGILNAIELLPLSYQKQIELTLVGNGDMRMALEEKAKILAAKVTFTGSATESEYYGYMLQSNCFILYSKHEGMPIAVIEGMRSGLPVVGSRVDGIPEEIEDGKTGYIVDLDEAKLAEVLKKLVDHKDKLPEMGKASYELFLKRFTIEAMVDKYSQIFKS